MAINQLGLLERTSQVPAYENSFTLIPRNSYVARAIILTGCSTDFLQGSSTSRRTALAVTAVVAHAIAIEVAVAITEAIATAAIAETAVIAAAPVTVVVVRLGGRYHRYHCWRESRLRGHHVAGEEL